MRLVVLVCAGHLLAMHEPGPAGGKVLNVVRVTNSKTDNWGPHGGGNGHIISAREFVVGLGGGGSRRRSRVARHAQHNVGAQRANRARPRKRTVAHVLVIRLQSVVVRRRLRQGRSTTARYV